MVENKIQTLRKPGIEGKALSFVKDMYWSGGNLKVRRMNIFPYIHLFGKKMKNEKEKK